MKKTVSIMILIIILIAGCHAVAELNFDLSVFKTQQGIIRDDCEMWIIEVDDMEARGFISLNVTGEYEAKALDSILDTISVEISPDVYLANYGTSNLVPLARIWLYFYSPDWLFADTAIFKIGDKTYTFDDIKVDTESGLRRYSSGYSIEEKLVCICEDTEFMDAWIENNSSIKMRLKGKKGYYDFVITEDMRKNIAVMFKNYKEAGGYDYLNYYLN